MRAQAAGTEGFLGPEHIPRSIGILRSASLARRERVTAMRRDLFTGQGGMASLMRGADLSRATSLMQRACLMQKASVSRRASLMRGANMVRGADRG